MSEQQGAGMTIDDGAGLKAARKALDLSVYELGELLRLQGGREAAGDFVRAIEEGRKPLSGPIAVAVELLLQIENIYCEGWRDGMLDGHGSTAGDRARAWQQSDARALLERRPSSS